MKWNSNISSGTFRDSTFHGTVSQIAAAVDVTRGTVLVTIVPMAPPAWLRPGQTVNVNIITNSAAQRLLVPAIAISRIGDHSGVLVVEQGRTLQKMVLTRPPTDKGVPVLAGLGQHDCLIANTRGIVPGESLAQTPGRDERWPEPALCHGPRPRQCAKDRAG